MAYDEGRNHSSSNKNRLWWKRRTKLEVYGIYGMAVAIVIMIGLIIAIAVVGSNTHKAVPSDSVCSTSECISTAADVLKKMDQSIDPCDDFYQFACGGFIKDTIIPPEKSEVTQISLYTDVVNEQLKEIFQEPIKDTDTKHVQLVKKLYSVCLNTTAIELEGLEPIKQLLQRIGGWPVLEGETWDETQFDWINATILFNKHGLSLDSFIKFGLDVDAKNSSIFRIAIDEGNLDIDRPNVLAGPSDELRSAYYDYMVDLAVIFGIERSFAEKEIKDLLDFKTEVAKIIVPPEQRRNAADLYNPTTIRELEQKHPKIPFLYFINAMIDDPSNLYSLDSIVNVPLPQYIGDLKDLLDKTPKRVQANYAIFQTIKSLVEYLPENVRQRFRELTAVVTGTSVAQPRWMECVTFVTSQLEVAVGVLYATTYFDEEAKQSATIMMTDIENEFIEIIKQLKWMDAHTKKEAIEKARTVTKHIGYPVEFLDDNLIESFYKNLEFTSEHYLDMRNSIEAFNTNRGRKLLFNPINKTEWTSHASVFDVNAGYIPSQNSIELPAGILQGVFFNKGRPQYMNYGGIAYVIGHELTHGFDNQGKKYDKNGNIENWWGEETDKAYEEKAECIVKQYGNYTVPEVGKKLDGKLTEGENIADNGGIKEAYLAYNNWIKRNSEEPTLPGLNYTAKQMFWIAAAHCWCSKERKASLENDISTDEHSPSRFRIIGPFSNIEHFSKDYNCPLGSKMNPVQKCEVW